MATYDLDRWSKWIRKRYPGEPSLTLHLHPHHCRFEHQNGVFLYDSPIRALLESIKDARLPVELLDLLDATAVKYYDGCLVVEVIDHRGVVDQEAVNENGMPASCDGSAAAAHSRSGSVAGGLDARRASRTIQNARGPDGSILKPSLSLSMNDANDPNAATFHKRFMVSYKRFEVALQEAAGLKASQIQRDKRAEEQRKQRHQLQQQHNHQDSPLNNQIVAKHDGQNKENGGSLDNSSIHSAIAAAVATATTMTGQGDAAAEEEALARTRPLVYRITLGPDIETVWTDLCAMREEKRAKWSEEDLLAIESRILALTTPPLCLSPDMQVSRIANALLDATSLPVTPAIPTRKRDLPLQPANSLTKSVKKAKQGDKAEKEADEKQEQEDEERAKVEAQESAERQEAEAWLRVMDESQANRLAFQPSFSRLAFVQNWREKKTAEEERVERIATEAAEAKAQAEADARAARIASKNNSRQGSVSRSRQGSVIDIPVNAPTPSNYTFSNNAKSEDVSMESQQAQILPKKKKTNKNKDKNATGRAGSPPNPNTSAADLSASTSNGPLSLKLTLPGKNKKKDRGPSKAGSPDIAVNPSPPPSANTPISMNMPNNNNTSTPTAAQQAIMRKTAALPKAKLKSDIKAQAQAQAAAQAQQQHSTGSGGQQQSQINGSPVSQQGTPQMQNQIQQMGQQAIRPASTNPQMNLPIQPQRNFASPVQNNQQQNAPQFPAGQQGGPMAGMQPGQPLNMEQTQEYVNQLQAQIATYSQQQQQGGRNTSLSSNISGSPYPQNMQIPQQQQHQIPQQSQFPMQPPQGGNTGPIPQNFANIHRSPVYNNATLPQQQAPGMQTPQSQHQFIPYSNSGSPPNVGNVPQGSQFTPQQAFQLQQLQQTQQNIFSQHTQALANFGQQSNNMQNNNMNFNNMGAYNPQQGQQPFGQQAMQNLSNMPNINLQNMQMNAQFNPALLNQLQRQQQSQQQPIGMQGFNGMQQNQWQGQQ